MDLKLIYNLTHCRTIIELAVKSAQYKLHKFTKVVLKCIVTFNVSILMTAFVYIIKQDYYIDLLGRSSVVKSTHFILHETELKTLSPQNPPTYISGGGRWLNQLTKRYFYCNKSYGAPLKSGGAAGPYSPTLLLSMHVSPKSSRRLAHIYH